MNIKNYAESLNIPEGTESFDNLRDVLYDVVSLCASRAGFVDESAEQAVMDLITDEDNGEIAWSEANDYEVEDFN